MQQKRIDEQACAVLALTTRLAWTEEFPQPLSRTMVRRMLDTGALEGLVLRNTCGVEEKWLERAERLLARVSDVYDRMEAYRRSDYELLFPGRPAWPAQLDALGLHAPLFLFAKGNSGLAGKRITAVAGSRRILKETACAAEKTGEMIAKEGRTLASGGAQGADYAAQCGALQAGGGVIIVPALPVSQLMKNAALAKALEAGKLMFLCDALPDEPFSAAKALGRNHTIYALGGEALIVAAREGVGGSWRGAADCLRGGWRPVYVWDGVNADTAGNRALEQLGAKRYTLDGALAPQLSEGGQTRLLI